MPVSYDFTRLLLILVLLHGGGLRAMASQDEIRRYDISLPADANGAAREAALEKFENMRSGEVIYLDLVVHTASDTTRPTAMSVARDGKNIKDFAKGCDIGPLAMAPDISYDLGPIAGNNHLLIKAFTGTRTSFPYNDVACEYIAATVSTALRLRGFFVVIENSVPTARALQLRPVNPPFERAMKALGAKQ